MKKSKQHGRRYFTAKQKPFFRIAVFASVLLAIGVVTAIAGYESTGKVATRAKPGSAPAQNAGNLFTIEAEGEKLKVNARTLQQGPLAHDQSQQIADALEGNKSTEGLVQTQHPDGTVSMNLEDRFQNVIVAKKNDDGTVSQSCVDNPEAASAFLKNDEATPGSDAPRKAASKE